MCDYIHKYKSTQQMKECISLNVLCSKSFSYSLIEAPNTMVLSHMNSMSVSYAVSMTNAGEFPLGAAHTLYASVRAISYSDKTSGDRALADVFLEFMYV